MRINAHAHVFNLRSVFTAKTLEIVLRRIGEFNLPSVLHDKVQTLLTDAITGAGKFTDSDALLKDFIGKLATSKEVEKAVQKLGGGIRVELDLLKNPDLVALGVKKLVGALFSARASFEEDAADQASIGDVLAFLALALRPSIDAVTDELMEGLDPDDLVVPLSLDVTRGGTEDAKLYADQLEKTSAQVLRYPGRMLPFVAVNGLRDGFLPIVERALNTQGFVGVKLYPSLGYSVDTPAMRDLYAYCETRGVPVLMHCNKLGFREKPGSEKYCNPDHWEAILKDYPRLILCFAHFGGGENLIEKDVPADSWTARILKLMEDYEGVYADISYHSEQMLGGDGEKNYFRHLKRWLNDPRYADRILFGTDFWLVRMILREENYWTYFIKKLGEDSLFAQIAETNPAAFLGLDGTAGRTWAIENQVDFVVRNQDRVLGANSATWMRKAVKKKAGLELASLDGVPDAWSRNNQAHWWTFLFIRDNQMYADDRPDVTFENCGAFPVSRLQYWNKEFESPSIFTKKCAALADTVDALFTNWQATYEDGYNRKSARTELTAAFENGSTRLADLAILADQIYRCGNEA